MVIRWPSTGPTTVSSIEPPAPGLNSAGDRASLLCLARFLRRGAGLPKHKIAAQWLRDCLQPGSQTQGSIEVAAERDGVCIATPRRAKFDIGVRSSKDGKSGACWWTLPLRRISARRSTRQDAQINYLSTLSIFMKQTTYLATLPNAAQRIRSPVLRIGFERRVYTLALDIGP
jgi:hypothetical protein